MGPVPMQSRPLLISSVDVEIEVILQSCGLTIPCQFERLLSPVDGAVHHIEVPSGDGAEIVEPEFPAIRVVEIAAGAVRLVDAVGAGPEQVQPVRLAVKLLGEVEPDLAPMRRLDARLVELDHLLLGLHSRQVAHCLGPLVAPRARRQREVVLQQLDGALGLVRPPVTPVRARSRSANRQDPPGAQSP
jgi:hypothetical protein